MGKLPKQFKDALSRIEVRGEKLDRAIAAHSEIRGYLEEETNSFADGELIPCSSLHMPVVQVSTHADSKDCASGIPRCRWQGR